MAFGGLFRSLHQLWLEVTGAFLLVFAAAFGFYAFREFRNIQVSVGNLWEVIASAGLSILTLCFGVHSFWKARKLR